MVIVPLALLLLAVLAALALLVLSRRSRPAGAAAPAAPAGGPPRWRAWWPVAVFAAAGGLAGFVLHALVGGEGHAAGHLDSATTPFSALALFAVVVWAVPRGRRGAELWVLGAGLAAAAAVTVAGNLRVVDAIGGERWSDEAAGALGAARPGFESGHDLAGRGMVGLVAAAALLALALLARRLVSGPAGIGSVVLSVVFPPWIVPGAGLLVLAVALVRRRQLAAASGPQVPLTVTAGGRIGWPGGRSVRDAGVRERRGPAGVRPESAHRG